MSAQAKKRKTSATANPEHLRKLASVARATAHTLRLLRIELNHQLGTSRPSLLLSLEKLSDDLHAAVNEADPGTPHMPGTVGHALAAIRST